MMGRRSVGGGRGVFNEGCGREEGGYRMVGRRSVCVCVGGGGG
jgi:hypothetical protein